MNKCELCGDPANKKFCGPKCMPQKIDVKLKSIEELISLIPAIPQTLEQLESTRQKMIDKQIDTSYIDQLIADVKAGKLKADGEQS